MADSLLAEAPGSLSGVARVLVNAGKLDAKSAESLTRTAKEQKRSFVSTLVNSGAIQPADLAHTLSKALAVPVMDLAAVDVERLPKGVIDRKLSAQYQVLVLSKRGNRLFVAGADPTDQEAIERIKFADKQGKVIQEAYDLVDDALRAAFIPEALAGLAAAMADGAVRYFRTSEEAAEPVASALEPGDLVLVKGSRGTRTDRVADRIVAEWA